MACTFAYHVLFFCAASVVLSHFEHSAVSDGNKAEKYDFSGSFDKFLMGLGLLSAVLAGLAIPTYAYLLGIVINIFYRHDRNTTSVDIEEETAPSVYAFISLAFFSLLTNYAGVVTWAWIAARQGAQIQTMFFRAVFGQVIAWFETNDADDIVQRFYDDTQTLMDSMQRVPIFTQWAVTWFASYAVALSLTWRLTLILASFCPATIIIRVYTTRLINGTAFTEYGTYMKTQHAAEHMLNKVATIQTFNSYEEELCRYTDQLRVIVRQSKRKALVLGIASSFSWAVMFAAYALAFGYGLYLAHTERCQPGHIFSVFVCVMSGSMAFGYALPCLTTFTASKPAATRVFKFISAPLTPDTTGDTEDTGVKPSSFVANIVLMGVYCRHAAKRREHGLHNLNLTIRQGETLVVLGSQKSGKSTLLKVLQRLYDPLKGQITVDGRNISDLNLQWLRRHIGVITGDPVVLQATITDNIRLAHNHAPDHQIEAAAKEAGAHKFIKRLPEGYDTVLAKDGTPLGPNQLEKLAIARALLTRPELLLVDNVSSLKHSSRQIIQKILKKNQNMGRTILLTATIASHALHCDKIVVLNKGVNVEEGTYQQLIAFNGHFAKMIKSEAAGGTEGHHHGRMLQYVRRLKLVAVLLAARKAEECEARRQGNSGPKSQSSVDLDKVSPAPLLCLLKLSRAEWHLLTTGWVVSLLVGVIPTLFALLIGEFIRVFRLKGRYEQTQRTYILLFSMFALAILVTVFRLVLNYCFCLSGARLTVRTRRLMVDALIHQTTGVGIGNIMEAISNLVGTLWVAYSYEWMVASVMLVFIPLVLVFNNAREFIAERQNIEKTKRLNRSKQVFSDVVKHIFTIVFLNCKNVFIDELIAISKTERGKAVKYGHMSGLIYGLCNSVLFFVYGVTFAYGAHRVQSDNSSFYDIFMVFSTFVFGALGAAGQRDDLMKHILHAKKSATLIFATIDRKLNINNPGGKRLEDFQGQVEVRDVVYHYPMYPSMRALDKLTVSIKPGQTVAVVGAKNSGKSTFLQLLLRWFDPSSGTVEINGDNLQDFDVHWWRQQVGYVPGQLEVFRGSVVDNIAYGDPRMEIDMQDIIEAAREADVHTAIMKEFPQGYSTTLDSKRDLLTEVQRARLAIARAVFRKPKLLLVSNLTLGMDSTSEEMVQHTLKNVQRGRTCIIVYNRLSHTVDSDVIVLLSHGRVIEVGSYEQLMACKGAYSMMLSKERLGERRSQAIKGGAVVPSRRVTQVNTKPQI